MSVRRCRRYRYNRQLSQWRADTKQGSGYQDEYQRSFIQDNISVEESILKQANKGNCHGGEKWNCKITLFIPATLILLPHSGNA
jgi:hypothetical protein